MRNFWCEVNLNSIDENIIRVKDKTNKGIMAVVKSNAYGLGIEEITAYINGQVDAFAVVTFNEALRVRSDKDILIMTPMFSDDEINSLKDNFVLAVDNEELLNRLALLDKKVRVHVEINTGMNRFGIKPDMLNSFIERIKNNYPNVEVDGIYTHLHNTNNKDYTLKQIQLFKDVVLPYKEEGIKIHLLNSNGFLLYNDLVDFDNMIRVGNILYGYNSNINGFKKSFSFKATPIRVNKLAKGEIVGYGNKCKVKKETRVGVLDLGLYDKFNTAKQVKHNVIYDVLKVIYHHIKKMSGISINGKNVKILGVPTMNHTFIDMENYDEETIFNIDMNPLISDSGILKRYRKGDSYVQL